MNNISKVAEHQCTGCGACYNSCPVGAITMEYNQEGFLQPVANEKCINCGKCLRACPVVNGVKINSMPDCYAVWANEETRKKSSSGGFFSVLSRYVLNNNGIVCGAAFDDKYLSVTHMWAENEEGLSSLRGSKYVQSSTNDTYTQTKKYLEQGRMVLYTGTPCQIAGLYGYLGKDYHNLYTADIVCHGVPSPKVYQSYITEKANGKDILKVDFREKEFWGWGTATSLFMKDGSIYRNNCYNDSYWRGFLGGLITRKSCGDCSYANLNRVGDFTLGDFWGIKEINEKCDDQKGTSLVLVNNDKAKKVMEEIKKTCVLAKKISVASLAEIAKTRNGQLLHPTKSHIFRERFFEEYSNNKEEKFTEIFDKTTKKYDVGYVGWWDSKNYGSALTSFALNKTLKKMGKSVLMLQHPGMESDETVSSSYGFQFARHFYDCSEIVSPLDYREYNAMCDTFLVGSDQIWNWWNINNGNTEYYFLNFVNNEHKKVAYATSFGDAWSSYPEGRRLRIGYLMSKFDAISVREKSGVSICERDFNLQATHVLDPVFLCDLDSYEEVAQLSKCKETEKYIFSYILDPTKEKIEAIKETAKKLQLPYKIVTDALKNNDLDTTSYVEELKRNDANVMTDIKIEDWLYYIKNSSFVVTDSFHAFCFSIIFNKQMFVYINERRGRSRFESLAEITGLENRLIESFKDVEERDLFNKEVDFGLVEEKLNIERIFSQKWLKNALNARKRPASVQELALWKILEHDKKINEIQVDRICKEMKELKDRLSELESKREKEGISRKLLKKIFKRDS